MVTRVNNIAFANLEDDPRYCFRCKTITGECEACGDCEHHCDCNNEDEDEDEDEDEGWKP